MDTYEYMLTNLDTQLEDAQEMSNGYEEDIIEEELEQQGIHIIQE